MRETARIRRVSPAPPATCLCWPAMARETDRRAPELGAHGRGRSTAFSAAAARDPVLVVPTVDDVERFEEELTRDGDAVIGRDGRHLRPALRAGRAGDDAPAGPAAQPDPAAAAGPRGCVAGRPRAARDLVAAARASRPRWRSWSPSCRPRWSIPRRFARARGGGGRLRAARSRRCTSPTSSVRDELGLHDDHSLAAAATAALRAAARRLGSAAGLPLRLRRPDASSSSSWSASSRASADGDPRPALGGPRVTDHRHAGRSSPSFGTSRE